MGHAKGYRVLFNTFSHADAADQCQWSFSEQEEEPQQEELYKGAAAQEENNNEIHEQ